MHVSTMGPTAVWIPSFRLTLPNNVHLILQVQSLRERLATAISHGPRTATSARFASAPSPTSSASPHSSTIQSWLSPSASPASASNGAGACGWLEAHLVRMRACRLDVELMHALCRADVHSRSRRSSRDALEQTGRSVRLSSSSSMFPVARSPSRSELRTQRRSKERVTEPHSSDSMLEPAVRPTLCAPCADDDDEVSRLASATDWDLASSSLSPVRASAGAHTPLPGMGEAMALPMPLLRMLRRHRRRR